MRQLICITFGALLLTSQTVLAQQGSGQFYFDETFFPVYVSNNDAASPAGGSVSSDVPTESGLGFDTSTTIGYFSPAWLGFPLLGGLTYDYYSVSTSRGTTAVYEGLEEENKKTALGATFGAFFGNWRFTLTYYFMADKEVSQKYSGPGNSTVSTHETFKNTDGSGYAVKFGYDFILGAGFGISPTLVYRSMEYGKQAYTVHAGSGTAYTSTALNTKAIDGELKPMITLSWRF